VSEPISAQREAVLSNFAVSRETGERLDILVAELHRWQRIKNLVGPATLSEVWSRHIADSLQLLPLAPAAQTWVDLGSGAGFPGLVLGLAGAERGIQVHLVESNSRKCAFLRHVARIAAASVVVHESRIENAFADLPDHVEVVTARALAPLRQLLDWAQPLLKTGAIGLFPKGRDFAAELTEAEKFWTFAADILPSRTDSAGRIVRISSLRERSPS